MVNLIDIITVTIVTGAGMLLLYSLISSFIVMFALRQISGVELRHLITALFYTLVAGFIYSLWYVLTNLNIISIANKTLSNLINNIVLMLVLVLVVYLSFVTRDVARKFGFKTASKDIQMRLNHKLNSK